jgi:hypothetical protein
MDADLSRSSEEALQRLTSELRSWVMRRTNIPKSHSPIKVFSEVNIKPEPEVEMKLYSTEIYTYEAQSPVYPRYSLEPRGNSAEAHASNERKPIIMMRSSNELEIGHPPRVSNEADAAPIRARSTASAMEGVENYSSFANRTGSALIPRHLYAGSWDKGEEGGYVVDKILAERTDDNGVVKYLVRWQDYVHDYHS